MVPFPESSPGATDRRVRLFVSGCRGEAHFVAVARQFRATVSDDVSEGFAVMIRKRLPSGARSQLIGPVRIPVSTISDWNKGCGVPDWNTGRVLTSTDIIFESGEM